MSRLSRKIFADVNDSSMWGNGEMQSLNFSSEKKMAANDVITRRHQRESRRSGSKCSAALFQDNCSSNTSQTTSSSSSPDSRETLLPNLLCDSEDNSMECDFESDVESRRDSGIVVDSMTPSALRRLHFIAEESASSSSSIRTLMTGAMLNLNDDDEEECRIMDWDCISVPMSSEDLGCTPITEPSSFSLSDSLQQSQQPFSHRNKEGLSRRLWGASSNKENITPSEHPVKAETVTPFLTSRPSAMRQRNHCEQNTEKAKSACVSPVTTPSRSEGGLLRSQSEKLLGQVLGGQDDHGELVGDFSVGYSLPTIHGKHKDLKSITPETVAAVLRSEYDDVISRFVIIDCRYPYEYQGGHIWGAKNLCTRDEIVDEFFPTHDQTESSGDQTLHHSSDLRHTVASRHKSESAVTSHTDDVTSHDDVTSAKRSIIIFHCEFSSERAPKLLRFLRNHDRNIHREQYPKLRYPEIYLLDGGYKAFYEAQVQFCHPQSYTPMLDTQHASELRHFRCKSKTWAGEKRRHTGLARRNSLRM